MNDLWVLPKKTVRKDKNKANSSDGGEEVGGGHQPRVDHLPAQDGRPGI